MNDELRLKMQNLEYALKNMTVDREKILMEIEKIKKQLIHRQTT